jgi:hypothetical protein
MRRDPASLDLLALWNIATVFINPRVLCEKEALFLTIGNMFVHALETRAESIPPSIYCHTLWAFAKGGHAHPQLAHLVAKTSVSKLDELDGRTLSVLAWSFAKLGVLPLPLFDAIEKETVKRLEPRSPSLDIGHLSNIVWSYPKLRHEASGVFYTTVESHVTARMCEANEIDLSNLAYGFSSCRQGSPHFYQRVAEEAICKIASFQFVELLVLLKSFAHAQV